MRLIYRQMSYALMFLAAALAIGAGAETASGKDSRSRGPDMADLRAALDLDDQQVEDVQAILNRAMSERRALLEQHEHLSMQERRQAMRSEGRRIRERTDAELAEVLTEDQLERYRELRARRRAEHSGRPGSHRGGSRP